MAFKKYVLDDKYKSFEIVKNDLGWHIFFKGGDLKKQDFELRQIEFELTQKTDRSSDEEQILKVIQEQLKARRKQ